MVFTVRCFKCGAQDVKLILGGRQILHARCQSCQTNLLAEILAFEQALLQPPPAAPATPEPPVADDAPTGDVPAPAPRPKQSRKPGRDTQPTRELKPISKPSPPSDDDTREMKLPDPDTSKA